MLTYESCIYGEQGKFSVQYIYVPYGVFVEHQAVNLCK